MYIPDLSALHHGYTEQGNVKRKDLMDWVVVNNDTRDTTSPSSPPLRLPKRRMSLYRIDEVDVVETIKRI